MVRDLIIDINERDLLVADDSSSFEPVFDTLWGNIFDDDLNAGILICNIIIPEQYWSGVVYKNNEFTCNFNSGYVPENTPFTIRLVGVKNGDYICFDKICGRLGLNAYSFVLNKNIAYPINACILPFIDIDGEFTVRLKRNANSENNRAYIYSSKHSDIAVNYSDDQASQLLSLCAPGKNLRYPTTGVDIYKYLNCVVNHSDLQDVLEVQFESDKKPIQDAFFDNSTCKLDILCSPEKEEKDSDLLPIEQLNKEFFELFTDEFVRKNIVLNQVSNDAFINAFNQFDDMMELVMFKDDTTSVRRISEHIVPGRFDVTGNIIKSSEYLIITEKVNKDTIIMFDDSQQDNIKGSPLFIVNDINETRLYTSLIEQPYWITETCNKCFILKKSAIIKYMIRKDRYRIGKGLYIVEKTSDNIKNMVGIVQDKITGRLMAIVSDNTNISDVTLDEITQHIYATHTSL